MYMNIYNYHIHIHISNHKTNHITTNTTTIIISSSIIIIANILRITITLFIPVVTKSKTPHDRKQW